jgi:PTS system galactitol-specific IIC component
MPLIPYEGEGSAFTIAITMASIMVLVPKMVSLIMEGLVPISDAVQAIVQKRGEGASKLYIGLDAAIALGQPLSLALSVILTPVMVLLAVGLAAVGLNNVMPAVDLAVLPFIFVFIAPMARGNAFRALLIGIIVIALALITTTMFAPLFTKCAIAVGAIEPGATTSSISGGCNIITFFLAKSVEFLGSGVGFSVTTAMTAAAVLYNGKRIRKLSKNASVAEGK